MEMSAAANIMRRKIQMKREKRSRESHSYHSKINRSKEEKERYQRRLTDNNNNNKSNMIYLCHGYASSIWHAFFPHTPRKMYEAENQLLPPFGFLMPFAIMMQLCDSTLHT